MNLFRKFEGKFLPSLYKFVLVFCGVFITLLISFQIFGRFIGISYRWSQEAARLLIIWATFASVALGIKRELLLRVDFIDKLLSGKVRQIVVFFRRLVLLLFSLVIVYYGFISVFERWNQLSPGLAWPMYIFVLPLPFFSIFIIIHLLYKIIINEGG